MISFEPLELISLSNTNRHFSLASMVFGKRVGGVDGNEAAYRWLDRFTKTRWKTNDADFSKFLRLISERAPVELGEGSSVINRPMRCFSLRAA